MRRIVVMSFISILFIITLDACSKLSNNPADTQFLQIQFQYGFKNELNTFDGSYQKDLVMDGTIKIPFWLTTHEQKTILDKVLAVKFFSFPDTLYPLQGLIIEPDPSPDFLRLKYQDEEKFVVWFYPTDTQSEYSTPLGELVELIKQIVESKPEYKRLPSARGGYL